MEFDFDRVDAIATEWLNRKPMPGLALAVVSDGRVVHRTTLGSADASTGRPVNPRTVFRVGSVAKTFVALAILHLAERGLVALDDPIHEHLRSVEFRTLPGARPATLHDALTHRTGVGELLRWSDLLHPSAFLRWNPKRPQPDLPTFYARGVTPEVAPGTRWAYANHVFGLLGLVIEDVSGEPFEQYVTQHLFEPLGMQRSAFHLRPDLAPDLAVGYRRRMRRGLQPVRYRDVVVPGAGGLFTTLEDLSLYAGALGQGGRGLDRPILGADSFEAAWTPHWKPDERLNFGQGYAFGLADVAGHRVVGHAGSWSGFASRLVVVPERNLGIVAMTNTSRGGAQEVTGQVLHAILGADEAPAPDPIPERPDLWADLIGPYRSPGPPFTNFRPLLYAGGELEVLVHGNALAIRGLHPSFRKPMPLRRCDPDDPYVYSFDGREPVIAFTPDAAGRAHTATALLGTVLELERHDGPSARRVAHAATACAALGLLGSTVAAVRAARTTSNDRG